MLSPRAEAPTANPDGRSAPDVSLDTRTWRCRADTTGHWGRLRREMGLLTLHGDGRQGYSIPGNAPASCGSGECRFRQELKNSACERVRTALDFMAAERSPFCAKSSSLPSSFWLSLHAVA